MLKLKGFLWLVNVVVVQAEYLKLLAWPATLSCDYSFNAMPLAQSLFTVQVAVAALIALAVLAVAWRALRDREVMFGLAWYIAPMLPATHVMVIGTLVAERLLYVPLIGWSVVAGIVCRRACGNVQWRQALALALVLCACSLLATRAVVRNRDWQK